MAIKLEPAVKYVKPMKIFLYGPSFSGKTYSAIEMAVGIVMKKRGCTRDEALTHIILLDSEYGRGTLHTKTLGGYNYHEIKPPYYTHKLVNIIKELNTMDEVDVIITDSLTHFWSKDGGILSEKSKKDSMPGGNSYTNWLEFTGLFNKMLDTLFQSPKHIIATARSKNDTVLEPNANGKMVPKTYGLKPELRDGVEYDFDISFNVDKESHDLLMDKGVPGMDPIYPAATVQTGMDLYDIFNAGAVQKVRTPEEIEADIKNTVKKNNLVQFVQLKLSGRKLNELTREELITLEDEMAEEIKSKQTKK
jgi:hypothetical protein